MIGVTQPRRVAAVTMASRIAKELNVKWGKDGSVAHQIRYDTKTVGEKTKLKLMTDGVLLRKYVQIFYCASIQLSLLMKRTSVA